MHKIDKRILIEDDEPAKKDGSPEGNAQIMKKYLKKGSIWESHCDTHAKRKAFVRAMEEDPCDDVIANASSTEDSSRPSIIREGDNLKDAERNVVGKVTSQTPLKR